MKQEGTVHQTTLKGVTWLRHTLLPRTFYSSRTLCIVSFTVFFKLACYNLLLNTLYPSAHFANWNFFFLLGTLCPQPPFSQNPFLLSTIFFSTPIAPQNTLLLCTLCCSAHFPPQHTLLLSRFAPWNTLLPRMLSNKGLQQAKGVERQNVLRSKV